jgi:predicted amidohydrolase YtcJ
METAAIIGMEDVLGSVEKGKYADFTIFSEDVFSLRPGEFSRLCADMTVVNGEVVHDVDAENDEFLLDMMIYNR